MKENSGQIPEKRRQRAEERGYRVEGEKMGGKIKSNQPYPDY